jgi:hypothetical protein
MKNSTLWIIIAVFIVLSLAGGAALTGTIPGTDGSLPDIVMQFATAIATAEGWFVSGSKAQRNNNPGNLTNPSGGFMQYATVMDGWNALYAQVELMFSGGSAHYNPSMTIQQVANAYAPDSPANPNQAENWANNVATFLGVSTDTTLQQLMGG